MIQFTQTTLITNSSLKSAHGQSLTSNPSKKVPSTPRKPHDTKPAAHGPSLTTRPSTKVPSILSKPDDTKPAAHGPIPQSEPVEKNLNLS